MYAVHQRHFTLLRGAILPGGICGAWPDPTRNGHTVHRHRHLRESDPGGDQQTLRMVSACCSSYVDKLARGFKRV